MFLESLPHQPRPTNGPEYTIGVGGLGGTGGGTGGKGGSGRGVGVGLGYPGLKLLNPNPGKRLFLFPKP
jgi:hypothetical protein